jgi:hypothetical protein
MVDEFHVVRFLEKKRTNSGPFMESTSKHSIYTLPSGMGLVLLLVEGVVAAIGAGVGGVVGAGTGYAWGSHVASKRAE